MEDADWKVLMEAVSIQVQALPFSLPMSQGKRDAIADHMIGVADLIRGLPVPRYVRALSETGDHLRAKLKVADLQVGAFRRALEQVYKNEGPGLDGSSENASGRIARIALEGPGRCCEGYAKHADAHSVGCVFLDKQLCTNSRDGENCLKAAGHEGICEGSQHVWDWKSTYGKQTRVEKQKGAPPMCDIQYPFGEGNYSYCGRQLGHEGPHGRNS